MGVRVGVTLLFESCRAPLSCSLEWTQTSVGVDGFRRDPACTRVSRVPRRPERGRRVVDIDIVGHMTLGAGDLSRGAARRRRVAGDIVSPELLRAPELYHLLALLILLLLLLHLLLLTVLHCLLPLK